MTRKLHLFITMLLCAVSSLAWADATINITAAEVNEGGKAPISFLADKAGGNNAPTYNTANGDYRIYSKGTLTISSTTATIKKVVFNLSTQGKKRLAPITSDKGTIATQNVGDETVTWTGEASEFTLTVGEKADYGSDGSEKAGQLCFDSVDVTYEGEAGPETTKFTITPNEVSVEVEKTTTVTITSNNTEKPITVTSNDPSIATISGSNGSYTVKGIAVGTTTITVSQAASSNFTACSATLNVTVKEPLPEGVLFNETFDKIEGKGGRDNTFSGSIGTNKADDLTDESGWVFSNNCGAYQCIKLGASSADWTATTREIALSGKGTLKFNAAGWATGATTFTITAEGGNVSGDTQITLENATWKEYTVNISDATGSLKIIFTGHRGFIDDVVVTEGEGGDNPPPETVFNSIAEVIEQGGSGKLKFNNVQVLYVNGNDMFAKDNTGAIDFYFEKTDNFNYTAGQKLNGTAVVTYKAYNEMPEITAVTDVSLTSTSGTVTPVTITAAANLPDYVCQLVKVSGKFKKEGNNTYLTDGTNSVLIYNKWKLDDINLGQVVEGSEGTATGIVVTYKSNNQIIYEIALTALEYESAGLIDPQLSFDPAGPFEITFGEDFDEPTLLAAPDFDFGIVKYSSSNTYVATVDEATGKVEIIGSGTTTIKATSEANEEFLAGSASYTLTVNKAPVQPGTDKFVYVADASTLAAGDVIILVGTNTIGETETTYAMSDQSGNFRITEVVTPESDGSIFPNSYVQQITLEGAADAWYLNVGDNQYLYACSSKSNYMKTDTKEVAGDNAKAQITIEEGVVDEETQATGLLTTILFQGENTRNDIRFNYNNGNTPRFACYDHDKTETPRVKIYRKVKSGTLLGDANNDGKINISDVTAIINYMLGHNPTPFNTENANVNKDEYINIKDVTEIINILLQ
ncbi:MAG: Ig-like domain-containing protein [Prevotella sp.]|nr:Ig-like domain-containing protein [Prevotella sp.]